MLEESNLRVHSMFGLSTYTKGRARVSPWHSRPSLTSPNLTFPALQSTVSLPLSHTLAKLGDIVSKFAFLSSCLDHTVPPSSEHHPHLPWRAHVPEDTPRLLVTLWFPLPGIDGLPLHFCLDKAFKVMSATTIYYTVFNIDLSPSINL